MTKQTKSQEIAADVAALLRARTPLLWIVTREEARVEGYLDSAARSVGYTMMTWDVAQGIRTTAGAVPDGTGSMEDPGAALSYIGGLAGPDAVVPQRGLWIMRDLPSWLAGASGATTLRQLRNLARSLPTSPIAQAQAIVVLSPSGDIPPEIAAQAIMIEWPLPDRDEIEAILGSCIASMPEALRAAAAPNGQRNAAIDAAIGLSGIEAASCYNRSLVQHRRIEPATVAAEKKRVIAREKVLEYFDPLPGGIDAVGGLDVLKGWLRARSTAYTPAARAYGLPAPKGAVLVGVPGCGKSLTAKAIATNWQVPLLRLDFGSLKSKFVGDSEQNLRKAFRVIEAMGRCVVWIDEIEKAMQGATSGSADGGVSSDALGAFLSWMQDRTGEAFVIATANEVKNLPPEMLRKGRFDEVWFVDTPTPVERLQIIQASLRSHGRSADEWKAGDMQQVVDACRDYTGSEIAALIPDAMFAAFADGGREVEAGDLLAAARTVVPLTKTADVKIRELREWAAGRARRATSDATTTTAAKSTARVLDIA